MKARQKKKKVAISFIRTRKLSACVFCRRSSEWQKFSWSCVLRRRWRRGRKIERGSCQSPLETRPPSHSSRTSGATGLRPWGSPILLRCNFSSINVFCNKTFQIVRRNVKIRCYQARTTLQPWPSSSFCPLLTTYIDQTRDIHWILSNLRHCDIFLIFSPDFHDLFKVVCSVASVWSWAGMRREDRELIRSSSESNTWWGKTDKVLMSAKRNTITWSAARVFVREWRRLFGDSSPLTKVNNEHDTKGETLFQVVPNWEGINVQSSWGCRLPKCGIHRVCFFLQISTSQTSHATTYCIKKVFHNQTQ